MILDYRKYLFLEETQVAGLLAYVRKTRGMISFTRCLYLSPILGRGVEIVRSETKDWDFESGQLRIRRRRRHKTRP